LVDGTKIAHSGAAQLEVLVEIGNVLSAALSPATAFQGVLEVLDRQHGALRGAVTLLNGRSGEISIEASRGLSSAGKAARYRLGEGIMGRVVETGKPIVVPQVSLEPTFLNRAGERRDLHKQELTYICVPIFVNARSVGALGVDLRYVDDRDYGAELNCLQVAAAMMAQTIKADHLVDEERRRLMDENTHLLGELKEKYDFAAIIGTTGVMHEVYEQIAQVADTTTTVVIRGESGTGKEMIAHAIHYNSSRAEQPFVKVSCAALPETLIESELFGYERGAFTGASSRKKGRFELAEGGTLFLDEIGDIDLSTQVKLLRVLQEKEFERLGGTETIRSNVRLIAATNKDLEKAIIDGTFREDLYYRLNVFSIAVPPLRERKSDLLLLADHFLQKFTKDHKKGVRRISTSAIDMFMSYHWPGNVRELENVIERAVLVCGDAGVIHGHHLPPTLQTAQASGTMSRLSLSEAVDAYEKDLLVDTLKTTRGNRAKAVRLLDTTPRILNYKVRKYDIDCSRFTA
jgi:Nif-specific regulatory protein